jgi:hypothetical protein
MARDRPAAGTPAYLLILALHIGRAHVDAATTIIAAVAQSTVRPTAAGLVEASDGVIADVAAHAKIVIRRGWCVVVTGNRIPTKGQGQLTANGIPAILKGITLVGRPTGHGLLGLDNCGDGP